MAVVCISIVANGPGLCSGKTWTLNSVAVIRMVISYASYEPRYLCAGVRGRPPGAVGAASIGYGLVSGVGVVQCEVTVLWSHTRAPAGWQAARVRTAASFTG